MDVVGPQLPHVLPTLPEGLSGQLHGVQPDFLWQAQRMPNISRRLLLEHADPHSVAPSLLLEELQLPAETVSLGAPVLRRPGLLSDDACATLRDAVDHDHREKPDSVDGAPDHQLNLSREQLVALIGTATVEALWSLPVELQGEATTPLVDAQIFVRRYTPETRPWNPWHVDSAAVTINVALSDDASCDGGELLALHKDVISTIARGEGDATVHSSTLLHAVSRLVSGVRYSLIIFIGMSERKLPFELQFDAASRVAEAQALAMLMADEQVAAVASATLGLEQWAALQILHEELVQSETPLGDRIEAAVQRYAAPHLRPANILQRLRAGTAGAAAWSLRALLRYAHEMMREAEGDSQTSTSGDADGAGSGDCILQRHD